MEITGHVTCVDICALAESEFETVDMLPSTYISCRYIMAVQSYTLPTSLTPLLNQTNRLTDAHKTFTDPIPMSLQFPCPVMLARGSLI